MATSYGRDAQATPPRASTDTGSRQHPVRQPRPAQPDHRCARPGHHDHPRCPGPPDCLIFADGKTTTLRYDLTPNSKGYLSEIIDRSGTTEYTRDAFGRVTAEEPDPGQRQRAAGELRLQRQRPARQHRLPQRQHAHPHLRRHRPPDRLNLNGTALVTNIAWNPLGQPTGWTWAFAAPEPCAPAAATTPRAG